MILLNSRVRSNASEEPIAEPPRELRLWPFWAFINRSLLSAARALADASSARATAASASAAARSRSLELRTDGELGFFARHLFGVTYPEAFAVTAARAVTVAPVRVILASGKCTDAGELSIADASAIGGGVKPVAMFPHR